MLRSIGEKLSDDDFEVSVLSSQPSYRGGGDKSCPAREQLNGMEIHRMSSPIPTGVNGALDFANMLLFTLRVFVFILFGNKYDFIMISTSPPVMAGFAVSLASRIRRSRYLYHCMDIHPEIGRISGEFRQPALFSFLRRLDALTCKYAARVVVLSKDMEQAIRARGHGQDARVSVINNFSIPDFDDKKYIVPPEFAKSSNKFRIIFAGNIGRFQGLESFVDAMKELGGRQDVEFVFMGSGKALAHLRQRTEGLCDESIRFFPQQPLGVAKAVIEDADLCVVSLIPGVIRYAYPSKTMAYLAQGKPLLVSVEPDSDLAKLVVEEGVGAVVTPGCAKQVSDAIIRFLDDLEYRQQVVANAKARGPGLFEEDKAMAAWSELYSQLAEKADK